MTTILATAPELLYAAVIAGAFMLACGIGLLYGMWELCSSSMRAYREHRRVEKLLKPLHGKELRMSKTNGLEPAIGEVLTLGGKRFRCIRDEEVATNSGSSCAGRYLAEVCLPVRCASDLRKDETNILLVEVAD